MLSFQFPWLAMLLPLPLLVYWLAQAYETRRAVVRVPFFALLARLSGATPRQGASVTPRGVFRTGVLILCWLLALSALMRPLWTLPPVHHEKAARDLLLLVDLSGSMDTEDFSDPSGQKVTRLTVVKQVLADFLAKLVCPPRIGPPLM